MITQQQVNEIIGRVVRDRRFRDALVDAQGPDAFIRVLEDAGYVMDAGQKDAISAHLPLLQEAARSLDMRYLSFIPS